MTERKRIVVIGSTGSGKSSLCNVIAGKDTQDSLFPVGHDMSSKTWQTTVASVKWRGDVNDMDIDIIDTPGMDDPAGPDKDAKNIKEMVKKLKDLGTVNLFFVVFNGARPRLDRTLTELLKIFQTVFGKDFLTSTIFGFSQWAYHPRAIKNRQKQNGKDETYVAKDLNNQLRKHGLLTTEDVPAVFIDSFFDPENNHEKTEFDTNMAHLRTKLQQAQYFQCIDFQEAKRDIQIAKEKAQTQKKNSEEAKKAKVKADKNTELAEESLKQVQKQRKTEDDEAKVAKEAQKDRLKKARADQLQASAESTPEVATRFTSELRTEQNTLSQDFPLLLNHSVEEMKSVFQVLKKGCKENVESVILELTPMVQSLSNSLKDTLMNVCIQSELIDDEFSFYLVREKKFKDDKCNAQTDLQDAELKAEHTKMEIIQAEDEMRLIENGVLEARKAVEAAKRKRDETLGWGIAVAVLFPPVGIPTLVAALSAAESNFEEALNQEGSAKTSLRILEDKKNLWNSHCENQTKKVTAIEADIRSLEGMMNETRSQQEHISELMKYVKGELLFFSNLDGKGEVLKNMTIGSFLLIPVVNVMLDLVSYTQTHKASSLSETNWSKMGSDLNELKTFCISITIKMSPELLMDFSDFC